MTNALGDEVLVALAALLSQSKRSDDRVGRLGGEEFVVLLHDIDPQTATKAYCSRIVKKVRELKFDHSAGFDGITISTGAAVCQLTEGRIDSMLRLADNAMYSVKDSGRNDFKVVSLPPD